MKTKIYSLILIGFVAIMASCGGSKATVNQGETELEIPCSGPEYRTNDKYFRTSASALSSDMNMAKTRALAGARSELATAIDAKIERVMDEYGSSYQIGEADEAKNRLTNMTRTVVKQNISDSRITCEKMMKTKDGKYRCYIAVEAAKDGIGNNVTNALKNDEKLRLDFEYEKFKKTFDEEMSKTE